MFKNIVILTFILISNFVYASTQEHHNPFLLKNILENFGEKEILTINIPFDQLEDKTDYSSFLKISKNINKTVNIHENSYEIKINTNNKFKYSYSDKSENHLITYYVSFGNVYKIKIENKVNFNEITYFKYRKIMFDNLTSLGFKEYSFLQKDSDDNTWNDEMDGESFIKDNIVISIVGRNSLNLNIVNRNHSKVLQNIKNKEIENFFNEENKKMDNIINSMF